MYKISDRQTSSNNIVFSSIIVHFGFTLDCHEHVNILYISLLQSNGYKYSKYESKTVHKLQDILVITAANGRLDMT